MALIVKIMSSEKMGDDQPDKSYKLFAEVDHVNFEHDQLGQPVVHLRFKRALADVPPEEITIMLAGNVYVMNEAGKTVSSWWPTPRSVDVANIYGGDHPLAGSTPR